MQSNNPDGLGYCKKPKPFVKTHDSKDSIEKLKYLMFTQELQQKKSEIGVLDPDVDDDYQLSTPKRLTCKRCIEALSHNKYNTESFPVHYFENIKGALPHIANVYHIVSLADFPFTLNKTAFMKKENINYLLLSKADQITYKSAILPHKGSAFFAEFCKRHIGVPVKKVVLFSSVRKWNIPSILNSLAKRCFLLGNPNVGKTSLINSLLKERLDSFQAQVDKQGNVIGPHKGIQNIKTIRDRINFNKGGVSHIPNFTQAIQTYVIDDKIVNDLPGYTIGPSETVDLSKLIEKENLDDIRKTSKFKIDKLIKKRYVSLKGSKNGKCLSFGGIFHLVPPESTINQVVNYIPVMEHEFSNVEKAISVSEEVLKNANHPLKKYFCLKHPYSDIKMFDRHVIPPFQGTVEIVIKDIGYFQVKPTGKYSFNGLYEIWVPKGIKVCIREPLAKLISTSYDKYIESKVPTDLCPDRPLVSDTYIMDHNEPDTLSKMKEMYMEKTKSDNLARRLHQADASELLKEIHNPPLNLYWYYKW